MDLAAQYDTLRHHIGAVHLRRDVLRVSGPDAIEYLQGQLSQDVAALAVGESALSFLLEPQGRIVVLLRAIRTTSDAMLLITEAGFGDAMDERLRRFKLRTKIDIDSLEWATIGLRGPEVTPDSLEAPDTVMADASAPGLRGVDIMGAAVAVPAGVPVCDDAYEAVRIEAGVPRMGTEITDKTMPGETGLVDEAVSFTKGCYTGQELVARVDSRGGNVPRRLYGVVISGEPPADGAPLLVGDAEVGRITSAARRPDGSSVALAYIKRGHEPPFETKIEIGAGSTASARVHPLPLVG